MTTDTYSRTTPTNAELGDQTLVDVPLRDVDAGARRRWERKNQIIARYGAPADTPLHRATDEHGVTRWYDAQGVVVARSSTPADDAATIASVNARLARRDWSWRAPLLLAAALLAVALLVVLASH